MLTMCSHIRIIKNYSNGKLNNPLGSIYLFDGSRESQNQNNYVIEYNNNCSLFVTVLLSHKNIL